MDSSLPEAPKQTAAPDPEALKKAVEQEVATQNRWLEFAQKQVDETRKFFNTLLTVVLIAFGVIVGSASYVFYKNLGDFRTETERKMQSQFEAFGNQLQLKTKEEMASRLDREFDRPNVQQMIETAARNVVQRRVQLIVRDALEPVQVGVNELEDRIKFTQLILQAQSDDRQSYEKLLIKALNRSDPSSEIARATVDVIKRAKLNDRYQLTDDESSARQIGKAEILRVHVELKSVEPRQRRRALQGLSMENVHPLAAFKSELDNILVNDPDLSVVSAAVSLLYWRYGKAVEPLDTKMALNWLRQQNGEPKARELPEEIKPLPGSERFMKKK